MSQRDEQFLKRLFATFRIEASEHLEQLSTGLVDLEQAPPHARADIVEVVFREAHSLKGAARAVTMTEIEALCQNIENILSALKREAMEPYADMYDVLHASINAIQDYLSETDPAALNDIKRTILDLSFRIDDELARVGNGGAAPGPRIAAAGGCAAADDAPSAAAGIAASAMTAPVQREVRTQQAPQTQRATTGRAPHERSAGGDTIRIATNKLDSLLLQTEELLTVKLVTAQHTNEAADITHRLEALQQEWKKMLPDLRALKQALPKTGNATEGREDRRLQKTLNFLDWTHSQISLLESRTFMLRKAFQQDNRLLGGMVDTLMADMKEVLMLPFATLLTIMPKVVRDLARDLGKLVDFEMKGADIEIDRRILEEMKDPLIHMIRNCIDHGIEKPGERTAAGKDPRGRISLFISRVDSGTVEILLADDGAGIDPHRVRTAAVAKGIVGGESADALSDAEAMSLVFLSDVSTASTITDLSGRGLGLAIVREKVVKLGGSVQVESAPGAGTTLRIQLPLTRATFRGILVTCAGDPFIIPTVNVERVVRIAPDDIRTVENRATVLHLGKPAPVVRLEDVLEMSTGSAWPGDARHVPALVLGTGDRRIVFTVDEILNEQEVLVKSFNRQLVRVRNIAGVTILGSGRVVPILNAADLLATVEGGRRGPVPLPAVQEAADAVRRAILVVDDSITSRMLLKDILESAGYVVRTAVDGVDALTTLKTGSFDLVVSDVEMPRMNGFELTAKVRTEPGLASLPVILVTALASAEDRERGVDAGANAYIVKSSFDQSNLLEIVQRLI